MALRWWSTFSVVLLFLEILPCVLGLAESKLANKTIERTVQLRTHSIFAPYIDQDLQNRWWDFGADAYVNTNKHIRLTRARPSEMGWLWSRLPLTAQNFVMEVEFKVSGESTHLYGDGLAVWFTTTRAQPGPVFGSIDNFEGLGIFLDTYSNGHHSFPFPRITAMLGDGQTSYDQAHDGDANSIGACSANFRRTNMMTKLKMTYIKDDYFDLKIHYRAWDNWTDCIRIDGLKLPASPFVGFSAMTGEVYDAHDIVSVTTWSAILSSVDAPRNKLVGSSSRFFSAPQSLQSSSWVMFFFKLFVFIGVCAGGYFGYQSYSRRNRQRYGGSFAMDRPMFGGLGGLGDRMGYMNGKRF